MAYALSSTGREQTRYTLFENNQVLTADQLNDLHQYLNVQDRATRTKVLGVGIIGGLQLGLVNNNRMVLSRGAGITTDGDLAWFDSDSVFTAFSRFEDRDAKYAPFGGGDAAELTVYELLPAIPQGSTTVFALNQFQAQTNGRLIDQVGILYLEEFNFDADLCTGADCDNKGNEVVRNWRVLLLNRQEAEKLKDSLPPLNQHYFALPDLRLSRIVINRAIDTLKELQDSLAAPLTVVEDIKKALTQAWQLTGFLAADLLGANSHNDWNNLLTDQFARNRQNHALQYLYDYSRDLIDAYQELKDLLFDDNVILCPQVEMFPKHLLLGNVKTAAALNLPGTLPQVLRPTLSQFTFHAQIQVHRFRRAELDDPGRHIFYESPILNAKSEKIQQIRFGWVRLNAMIRSFSIPDRNTLGTAATSIRITPGTYTDVPLGNRAIPFYYGFSPNSATLPAYWSYEANIRRRETRHRSYFADKYSQDPYVTEPFTFDLLEATFYRIEGHLGLRYTEVERRLAAIINTHNLPINIMTVQVEKIIETVPVKPWWFNHLNFYELIQRRTLVDQLNQAEMAHNTLADELKRDPARAADLSQITPVLNQFNAAKAGFVAKYAGPVAPQPSQPAGISNDFTALAKSATLFKAGTRQFGFSNTAVPHDFVINTNTPVKLDLIRDLIQQETIRKRQDHFLGNYMVKNPGLEHAAGVLRGGTFVLVYSSADGIVVADFMLPYASVDAELPEQLPEVKPIPEKPRFELPAIWEKIPQFEKVLDKRWLELDTRFTKIDTEVINRIRLVNEDVTMKFNATQNLMNTQIGNIDKRIVGITDNIVGRVDTQVTNKMNTVVADLNKNVQTTLATEQNKFYTNFLTTAITPSKGTEGRVPGGSVGPGDKFVFGNVDVTADVGRIRKLTEELSKQPASSNTRPALEADLANSITSVNEKLIAATRAGQIDAQSVNLAKAIQFDATLAGEIIQNAALKNQINTSNNQLKNIMIRR